MNRRPRPRRLVCGAAQIAWRMLVIVPTVTHVDIGRQLAAPCSRSWPEWADARGRADESVPPSFGYVEQVLASQPGTGRSGHACANWAAHQGLRRQTRNRGGGRRHVCSCRTKVDCRRLSNGRQPPIAQGPAQNRTPLDRSVGPMGCQTSSSSECANFSRRFQDMTTRMIFPLAGRGMAVNARSVTRRSIGANQPAWYIPAIRPKNKRWGRNLFIGGRRIVCSG